MKPQSKPDPLAEYDEFDIRLGKINHSVLHEESGKGRNWNRLSVTRKVGFIEAAFAVYHTPAPPENKPANVLSDEDNAVIAAKEAKIKCRCDEATESKVAIVTFGKASSNGYEVNMQVYFNGVDCGQAVKDLDEYEKPIGNLCPNPKLRAIIPATWRANWATVTEAKKAIRSALKKRHATGNLNLYNPDTNYPWDQ